MDSMTEAIIKQRQMIKGKAVTQSEIAQIIAAQNKREDDKNMYGDTQDKDYN